MQRAGDGGERESKDVMVSEGTFMTKCKVILGTLDLIIRARGSNLKNFMQEVKITFVIFEYSLCESIDNKILKIYKLYSIKFRYRLHDS